MKIPEWLRLQTEIDYWHWELSNRLNEERLRAPIERMIDQATGYDKVRIKEAKKIIVKLKKLKERFYKLKP